MSDEETKPRQFIKVSSICRRWSCSFMTVERLIQEDERFPAIHVFGINGRDRRVDVSDLEQYERLCVVQRRPKKLEPA
jgi:hypothetical protein